MDRWRGSTLLQPHAEAHSPTELDILCLEQIAIDTILTGIALRREGRRLDLVTMGRAIVDIYGEQIGCRLEDVSTFAKYVGGCPANIAIGVSRLGLNVGMITRVG